jgi:hypothetical protein
VNKEVRIGFRARDGVRQDFPSDIYLNDIEITSTLSQDAGPVQFYFNPPIVNNSLLKDSVYNISMRITNFGIQPINSVPCGVKLDDGTLLQATPSGSIAPGQSATYDLGNHTFTNFVTNKKAKFFTGLTGDQATVNDTLVFTYSIVAPVAVNPTEHLEQVRVYPNPSSGKINILFGSLSQNSVKIEILDSQGRLVVDHESASGEESKMLDLSLLPKGLYQLRLKSGSGFYNKLIVLN